MRAKKIYPKLKADKKQKKVDRRGPQTGRRTKNFSPLFVGCPQGGTPAKKLKKNQLDPFFFFSSQGIDLFRRGPPGQSFTKDGFCLVRSFVGPLPSANISIPITICYYLI